MTREEAQKLEQKLSEIVPNANVHLDKDGNLIYISCWEGEVIMSKIKPSQWSPIRTGS